MCNTVFINDDGETFGVSSHLTKLLALPHRSRMSHVEPVNKALRWLFYFIRDRVSDESFLASFTRQWPCKWQANISSGPKLGPFNSRSEAIRHEIDWINNFFERGI